MRTNGCHHLRREGVVNNREGLCLMGMPRDDYNDGPKYASRSKT